MKIVRNSTTYFKQILFSMYGVQFVALIEQSTLHQLKINADNGNAIVTYGNVRSVLF